MGSPCWIVGVRVADSQPTFATARESVLRYQRPTRRAENLRDSVVTIWLLSTRVLSRRRLSQLFRYL